MFKLGNLILLGQLTLLFVLVPAVLAVCCCRGARSHAITQALATASSACLAAIYFWWYQSRFIVSS